MEYEINPKKINTLTALPLELKDYISEISGDSLKILYLIFCENNPSPFEISTTLGLKLCQVEDALRYWKSKGILIDTKSKNTVINIDKPNASQISSEELKIAKEENKNIAMLFEQSEHLYSRPLKPTERRTLLYIYEYYDLPIDVILMVVDFCIRYSKPPRQILSICEDWSDNGIISHEQAENQIQVLVERNNVETQVRHCFGIHDRKLSSNEKKSIHKWFSEYKFTINMIQLAFYKCVDSIGKLSFPYIGKILSTWYKNNVKTPEDIEKFDLDKKVLNKSKTKSKNTSYDLNELTKGGLFIPE